VVVEFLSFLVPRTIASLPALQQSHTLSLLAQTLLVSLKSVSVDFFRLLATAI
jgi:hypothetical protein